MSEIDTHFHMEERSGKKEESPQDSEDKKDTEIPSVKKKVITVDPDRVEKTDDGRVILKKKNPS